MIQVHTLTLPQAAGQRERRCYVYLPGAYQREPERRFPVMYMFDGHNVFFDEDATYGTSWRMGEYLDAADVPLIVVAPECDHEGNARLSEYSPFDFEDAQLGHVVGRGAQYMEWLTGTLKPQVDAALRTLPDAADTAIAGSSMGGLMALYGVTACNHVFHRAACLSPSLWTAPKAILHLAARAPMARGTRIYMDYGQRELGNHDANLDVLARTAAALTRRRVGLTWRIVPGGRHCEASWRRQIPLFLECLGFGGQRRCAWEA